MKRYKKTDIDMLQNEQKEIVTSYLTHSGVHHHHAIVKCSYLALRVFSAG
jgi:hypothetical protein